MSQALTPLLAFVAVVALIPVVLWLVRRSGVAGGGQQGILNTVASLAVSPAQRVVVVSLQHGQNTHWLVLGVGGESVTTIATLDAPPAVPPEVASPQAPTVAQLMARWRQGGPDAR